MLRDISIKTLYSLALAEGEGVGTAYEYFAKRLILAGWLNGKPRPQQMLIAGLPQKYGASLDFLQLAADLDAAVTIADDRPQAFARLQAALNEVKVVGQLQNVDPDFCLVKDIATFPEIAGHYDLVLSCEVLQRIAPIQRPRYISRLLHLTDQAAIFVPNDDNPAHTDLSKLSGLKLAEFKALVSDGFISAQFKMDQASVRAGYIDMPPFPPGITRTEEQREHASTGKLEAVAMWGLSYYARLEAWFPHTWRRSKSHIVYALLENSQR